MEKMCKYRQRRWDGSLRAAKVPMDLRGFCYAHTRRLDQIEGEGPQGDCYSGKSGGLERYHEYYGARQVWSDGWEEKPEWEVSFV